MGRPTESPKTYGYRLRLSEKEMQLLNNLSEKSGLKKSDVLRLGLNLVYKQYYQT